MGGLGGFRIYWAVWGQVLIMTQRAYVMLRVRNLNFFHIFSYNFFEKVIYIYMIKENEQ